MRINCHAHVFNLRSLLTDRSRDVVRQRIESEVEPEVLAKIAGQIVVEIVEAGAAFDEEALLRSLLERLKDEAKVKDLLDKATFLPATVRHLLEARLDDEALGFLRRAADSLVGVFRREADDDITAKSLYNTLDLLRLISRPRIRDVADRIMSQLALDEAAVLLALDITGAAGEEPAGTFAAQIADTTALIPAYPGRVFPFYGLHPDRPDPLARLRQAVEEMGCVGVKIYPSTTGWKVSHPEMDRVFAFCHSHGLPLLMHCNKGGFYTREADTREADPDLWKPILAKFPGLKICFAHFGGAGGIAKEQIPDGHWAGKILALMEAHEGVYTDVSAHSAPMKDEATRATYFRNLKQLLNAAPSRERILFGTDFWLMRVRLTEARHWRFFEENLTAAQFERMAVENPRRFLGLPEGDDGAASIALGRYADFLATRVGEVEGPVPKWLLRLVEARKGTVVAQALEAQGARFVPHPGLVIRGWRQRLEELAGKLLIPETGVSLASGEVDVLSTQFSSASLGLTGSGAVRIDLFTDEDQRDEDGILLPPPGAPAGGGAGMETPRLGLQIPFSSQHSWLKYRLAGKLRLRGQGELASVGLNLDAEREAILADYRIHPPGGNVVDAVRADLARPRFALNLNDVLRLAEGEALSFACRGSLAGGASVSWAEVLTGGLGSLARALEIPAAVLRLKLDLGATVSARLTLTDDFRVVFTRRAPDNRGRRYRVALFKLDARKAEARVEVGAELQLENPQALQALVGQLLEQKLGATLGRVEALLKKQAASLGAGQKKLLADLERRLGEEGLEAVGKAVDELREKAAATLRSLAEARLTAGFTYEYARRRTGTVLVEALLSEEALMELHDELVDGDLSRLVEEAGPGFDSADVRVERYLVERREETRRAWGFTLGSTVAGKEIQETELVVQEAVVSPTERRKRVAYRGALEYQGKWPDLATGLETWTWRVDLSAEMPGFSATSEPLTSDFRYGLAFLFEWSFQRAGEKALLPCLDAAALWGVIPDEGPALGAEMDELRGLDGQPVSVGLQLLCDHGALMALLPEVAEEQPAPLALALAAAMPYHADDMRSTPASRRRAYGGLWEEALQEVAKKVNGTLAHHEKAEFAKTFAAKARAALRDEFASQAQQEGDRTIWESFMWTLGGMLRINPFPLGPWRQLQKGLTVIAEAEAGQGLAYEKIRERIHEPMHRFWSQTHWVRTLGCYLVDRAGHLGARSRIASSPTVTAGKEGEAREVLVLGSTGG